MNDQTQTKPVQPHPTVEQIERYANSDLRDLCDATDEAIREGGGFGWTETPARDILERYWQGVLASPTRMLFVARMDGIICGTGQLILPPSNNEAQSHAVQLTTNFIAPWARGYGLAKKLLVLVEDTAREDGYSVVNLDVRETAETAIKLYESQGYTRIGTHPDYARVDDAVLAGYYYCKRIEG